MPWLLYRASKPHVTEAHAIMISSGAPAIWGIVQFVRNRKVDTFSILSLSGIVLSLAIFAFGGSPKVLLVRESLIVGAIGVLFILSAMIGRPLMLEVMRGVTNSMPASDGGKLARAREELETYAEAPFFRRLMTTMTVGFGIFGIAEMAARMALAFTLPTERFLLIAPVVRYAIAGVSLIWVWFYVVPVFRRETGR